jgi:mannose-6-phosphate isomerase-like protein (cupin superfamily)
MHPEVTEIYYIVSGSGTLVSGGRLVDPKAYTAAQLPGIHSPTFHGTFEGGVTRKVAAGDIIVNPPSTVHTWKSIADSGLVYIVLWVDPEHKQPAGYVDPVVKK